MHDLELPVAMRHSGNSRRIAQICRDLGYEQVIEKGQRIWRVKNGKS
jgi:hypothetical protein